MSPKRLACCTILAVLVVLASAWGTLAWADEHADRQPDYGRTGSIAVDIHTSEGQSVPGGTLTLYLVADAVYDDGNNVFVFTDEFRACGLDLAEIAEEDNGAPEMSATLATYASKRNLKGTVVPVGNTGRAVFKNLKLGLYLVVQEQPASGYLAIAPFSVTVPMWDGQQLIYDVYANPKPGTATKTDEPPTPDEPEQTSKLPQTGQLWWPVWVLAGLGICFLVYGLLRRRKDSRN